jgi:uncharacterized RDD family membrane protein YckC
VNFSLPTWTYFILADSSPGGATVGKWLLGLHVARVLGGRLGWLALLRCAVKLLPWEAAHMSAFLLSMAPVGQLIGLGLANALALAYFGVAAWTRGRRSVHDYVASTEVCLAPGRSVAGLA